MILAHIFVLLVSFYFLAIITHEYFLHSVDYIAKKLKIHSDVAGATLLAAGSSAPELFIALIAILIAGQHESIGVGTIIGSALFNLLVIVGVSSLFNHAELTWQTVVRDLLFYAFSVVLLIKSFWDGTVTLLESAVFVFVYVVYVYAAFRWEEWFGFSYHDRLEPRIARRGARKLPFFDVGARFLRYVLSPKEQKLHYIRTFLISIILIGFFSYVMVESAVSLSGAIGVPEGVIALTILAIGTSIPDLLSSFFVSNEGRGDMAISNAIGSNVFNVLVALGLPWFVVILSRGEAIDLHVRNGDLLSGMSLLLAAVVCVLGVMIFNKWRVSRNAGALLIFSYVMFLVYVVIDVIIGKQ